MTTALRCAVQRALSAWDTTTLKTNGDGMLSEAIESLRAEFDTQNATTPPGGSQAAEPGGSQARVVAPFQAPEGAPDLRTAFESWALHTPPDDRTNWEVFQAGARAALAAQPAPVWAGDPSTQDYASTQSPAEAHDNSTPHVAESLLALASRIEQANETPIAISVTAARFIRAALATQPQPKGTEAEGDVVVTWDQDRTRILAVTRQDDEGRIISVIAKAPAPAATETVAWRWRPVGGNWCMPTHKRELAEKLAVDAGYEVQELVPKAAVIQASAPAPDHLELFKEVGEWAETMKRKLTPDMIELLGWLTGAANAWAEKVEVETAKQASAVSDGKEQP